MRSEQATLRKSLLRVYHIEREESAAAPRIGRSGDADEETCDRV